MKIVRLSLVFGVVLFLYSGAWAAKKLHSASSPTSTAIRPEPSKVIAGNRAPAQEAPALTKSAATPSAPVETTVPDNFIAPQNSSAATYQIPWQSVNGGGGPMTSTNYSVNSSVGQASIGYNSSANYAAGVGYWYGVSATTGCSCPRQCDYDNDGFLTSVDLGTLIDVLFAGVPEITDPGCPTSRGDFDCDGFPTSVDLGGLIDHLFAGGSPPCDPCNP